MLYIHHNYKRGSFALFKNVFKLKSKKTGHVPVKARICVLPLIFYDDKTETLDYGKCFTVDVISISTTSITVRHNNMLKKGNILEFRTKHALEDVQCLKCLHFKTLSETPAFGSFIGKIIWRSNEEAGVSIMMMRDRDRDTIAKMVAERTKK